MSFVGEVMVLELGNTLSAAKGILKLLFVKMLEETVSAFFIFIFERL